jgi:hypothetical protein
VADSSVHKALVFHHFYLVFPRNLPVIKQEDIFCCLHTGHSVNLSFHTSQRKYSVSVTKSKRLMIIREIIDFVCENGTEHTRRPKASMQNPEFLTTHVVTARIKRLIRVLYVYLL